MLCTSGFVDYVVLQTAKTVIVANHMTLSDLQGHSPIESLFT